MLKRVRRKLPSSMSARLVRALTLMQSGRKLLSTERKMLKRVRRRRKKRLSIFNAPTDRRRSLTSISPLLMSLVEVAAEAVAEDAEAVDVTAVTALIVETDQIVVTDPIAVTDQIVEIVTAETVKIVVELPVVVDLAVEAVEEAIVDLVVAAERKSSS